MHPEIDAKILDRSVVVNMLLPKSCSTFGENAEQVFLPYVLRNLNNATCLDVVWDRYIDNSLKHSVRQRRIWTPHCCQELNINPKELAGFSPCESK